MKDFDEWNEKKKRVDKKINTLYFKAGDVWWINLGLNVGFEIDGKGKEFRRPVLILKKYNKHAFLALPLSTSVKIERYRVYIGIIDDKNVTANFSQIRSIDSRRLVKKIKHLPRGLFLLTKEKASQLNFG